MRSNFINNFYRDDSGDDGSGFIDAVDSLAGDASKVITALKGNTKTVSYSGSGATTYKPSTTNNNTVIYILIALAAIVGLYLFLKK